MRKQLVFAGIASIAAYVIALVVVFDGVKKIFKRK